MSTAEQEGRGVKEREGGKRALPSCLLSFLSVCPHRHRRQYAAGRQPPCTLLPPSPPAPIHPLSLGEGVGYGAMPINISSKHS